MPREIVAGNFVFNDTNGYQILPNNLSNHATTLTSQSRVEWPEKRVAMAIALYVLPCVIFLGTVGNTLAFVVLLT